MSHILPPPPRKNGFTLAEVLITLAIIGVVAALTIPSVIANTQQQEFKTGLKKAVSVLNSAITMNMAIEGESPYDTNDLYQYFTRHMNIMKSMALAPKMNSDSNLAFYTTDGMRFEMPVEFIKSFKLYESDKKMRSALSPSELPHDGNANANYNYGSNGILKSYKLSYSIGHCGSLGLNGNTDDTITTPCYLLVDVNGDRKPNPSRACLLNEHNPETGRANDCSDVEALPRLSDPNGKKLTDVFLIMITDKQAIPYGTAAQKAMYNTQK